jgi:hypothetical protein
MKQPIALISNDWHLKRDNIDLIKDLIRQKCELAVKLGIKRIFALGDLMDSRKSQTLDVLKGFEGVLDIVGSYGIELATIPGNHEKSNYSSDESFLEPFKHHPNFILFSNIDERCIQKHNIHFLPFWEDSIMVEKLKQVPDNAIVFSHFGTNSSTNNDGTKHNTPITIESLKRFKKVFLGHFHNKEEVTKDIIHLPSLYQQNYGETNLKGFTILYDDLSYEIHKAKFPEYIKIKIDIDKVDNKELDRLMRENANSDNNVCFEFLGSENKLKSIKKDLFTANGIEVRTKIKEIQTSMELAETDEVISFNKANIEEEFELFCEENELNLEDGKPYLQKILKNG